MRADFDPIRVAGGTAAPLVVSLCLGFALMAVFAFVESPPVVAQTLPTQVDPAGANDTDTTDSASKAATGETTDAPSTQAGLTDDSKVDGGIPAAAIPAELTAWKDWVLWDNPLRDCPSAYNDANEKIAFWPSRLSLSVNRTGGTWELDVTSFADAWIPIPGSGRIWPTDVKVDGAAHAVLLRHGVPSVRLAKSTHRLSGQFVWKEIPQQLRIPRSIGMVSLTVNGSEVAQPARSTKGMLWLQRRKAKHAEADLLSVQVYRVIEDGIPMWLETVVELTVFGKSREEEIGWILPEGFLLATVDSPIPVAIDNTGNMKAQVRAGKWTIRTRAFRNGRVSDIGFPEQARPIADEELVAFASRPDFRVAEVEGLEIVDVKQTTFPAQWRQLPIYRWPTEKTFRLNEKIRGAGEQHLGGLKIRRQMWLDDNGQAYTYQDDITATLQRIWRLDVADGYQLGAVRSSGVGQLITKNPQTEAIGIEVRDQTLELNAVGRILQQTGMPATGWQSDAESLEATLILPPGWRAFACFGADSVEGDWLTAWSLLDMFLLLLLSFAVFRIWGSTAGLVALLAFGMAYHEAGSPRWTWFFLLLPVALSRVVPAGGFQRFVNAWKATAVIVLLLALVPFIVNQVQSAIYPQLEKQGIQYQSRNRLSPSASRYAARDSNRQAVESPQKGMRGGELGQQNQTNESDDPFGDGYVATKKGRSAAFWSSSNLSYAPEAKIQTGPAKPEWTWNQVICRWDGPVAASERIRPILIPRHVHQFLNVVRVILLLLLTKILIGPAGWQLPPWGKKTLTAGLLAALFVTAPSDSAYADQIPSPDMLAELKKRLTQPSDAFPRAAEIASVDLTIADDRLDMTATIHTAIQVAVPLPGVVPESSPVSVLVDGQPAKLVCRKKDYLWVVLPEGVHQVTVQSILPEVSEWEWTYLLAPHRVTVDAPDWTITGIDPNGRPETEVSFMRQQHAPSGQAAYNRNDFHTAIAVDRHLEIGLTWQVRTVVTRLSKGNKAISLQIPLLPNEKVLSSDATVRNGRIEVRLASGQDETEWSGELPTGSDISLATRSDDSWVEQWHLVTSPVWNVTQSGLTPIFDTYKKGLVPTWQPWPGESVELAFSRPQAVKGDVLTIQQVTHRLTLGKRQRTTEIAMQVECSIGADFSMAIPESSNITKLTVGGQVFPVRREGSELVFPVRPGKQPVVVRWQTPQPFETVVSTDSVTLPFDGANVQTEVRVTDSRWVLWTDGPQRGPAVRFWVILVSAAILAVVLGAIPASPLNRWEWMLLSIGLTQVSVVLAMIVVGWLFLLAYRGRQSSANVTAWRFNSMQIFLAVATIAALGVFCAIVAQGLLGAPDMFIRGNGSTRTMLRWFQPRSGPDLSVASIVSVPLMYFRLLMLGWALWLSASLIRWLQWGWNQWSHERVWISTKPRQPEN